MTKIPAQSMAVETAGVSIRRTKETFPARQTVSAVWTTAKTPVSVRGEPEPAVKQTVNVISSSAKPIRADIICEGHAKTANVLKKASVTGLHIRNPTAARCSNYPCSFMTLSPEKPKESRWEGSSSRNPTVIRATSLQTVGTSAIPPMERSLPMRPPSVSRCHRTIVVPRISHNRRRGICSP